MRIYTAANWELVIQCFLMRLGGEMLCVCAVGALELGEREVEGGGGG